jgi:hypothetical protein
MTPPCPLLLFGERSPSLLPVQVAAIAVSAAKYYNNYAHIKLYCLHNFHGCLERRHTFFNTEGNHLKGKY